MASFSKRAQLDRFTESRRQLSDRIFIAHVTLPLPLALAIEAFTVRR
ncbi:MAG: hypothetical protein IPJ07_10710 [Acidobacteria bacterium]|nr:hypothetical protein [Acidobacteriota bacterium]